MTASFTSERAEAVLIRACYLTRLDPQGATRLRFGENAIYNLPRENRVVRIGRSIVAAAKEVHIAGWLEDHEFPAVKLAPGFADGPMIVDDLPVTVWHHVDQSDQAITTAEFGRILRGLHSLPRPVEFQLPQFHPMPKIIERIDQLAHTTIPESDLLFLRDKYAEILAAFDGLDFALPQGPIHGDAHPGNLMRTVSGEILLIDFEDFAHGPREWDAAVMSVRHQAFGWESAEDYRSYVEAYGFDPLEWSGYSVIRAARELNMTTWLAQKYGESRRVDAEISKRITDLRDDQAVRHWSVF